jgi:hypothetical protein
MRDGLDSVPGVWHRFRALVLDQPPALRVTREWRLADVVAHVATIAAMDVGLIHGAGPAIAIPGFDDLVARTTVDSVNVLNDHVLAHFTDRDVPALIERLDADIATLAAHGTAGRATADPVSWLGGARVPVSGLHAHLLNEMNIHAWDITRACGRPWAVDPADAALFIDEFVAGMVRYGCGRLLDRDRPFSGRSVTVAFDSGHGLPVRFEVRGGLVREIAGESPADVHLTYDPPTFNLMSFGRIGRGRAILSGRVRIGGRRPWLLPVVTATLRFPS